jgi:hypothetical protein
LEFASKDALEDWAPAADAPPSTVAATESLAAEVNASTLAPVSGEIPPVAVEPAVNPAEAGPEPELAVTDPELEADALVAPAALAAAPLAPASAWARAALANSDIAKALVVPKSIVRPFFLGVNICYSFKLPVYMPTGWSHHLRMSRLHLQQCLILKFSGADRRDQVVIRTGRRGDARMNAHAPKRQRHA